jgi:hypothetical protein
LSLAFCQCHAVIPSPGLMASGTLVVLIPSKDGLVFAADSRSSVPGAGICDKMFKIVELRHRKRTAIAVTGNPEVMARPSDGSTPPDLCAYFKTAQHYLDIPHVVQEELDADNQILDSPRIKKLGARCVQAVTEYSDKFSRWKPLDQFRGKERMFKVVIGTYKPTKKTSLIISFPVRIRAEDGKPEMGEIYRREVTLDAEWRYLAYGVSDYVQQTVFSIGQQYLGAFAQLRANEKKKNVRDITASEAQAAATSLIEATEQTATIVPPPSEVGGPVDVILIDGWETPTHLVWKHE